MGHNNNSLASRLRGVLEEPALVSKPKSNHFAAGIRWRINSCTGELEFLTIVYTEARKRSVRKFPGGTNRVTREPLMYRDEQPHETLRREWLIEVGQNLVTVGNKPASFPVRDGHVQFYYLISEDDVRGDLRVDDYVDKEVGRPDEVLGPPQWFGLSRLVAGPDRLFGNHYEALVQYAVPTIGFVLNKALITIEEISR
jgi:hypothetical protein